MMWTNPKGERVHGFLRKNEIIRTDDYGPSQRIERLCKCGVGHPIGSTGKWAEWMGVHGCCGCCYKAEFWLETMKETNGKVIEVPTKEDDHFGKEEDPEC